MKVNCNRDGNFTGLIPDIKTYDEVKNGTKDWKSHIKPKLKAVTIPFELFEYFLDLDRELDKRSDDT